MANNNPAHVVLTNVRLSYVNLLSPKAGQNGGDPKYSCTVLVPKMPGDNRAKIDAAIRAAAEKARAKHGAAFPAQPKVSVHDGDGVRPSDNQPFGPECKGCWVFTASSKVRPRIVDLNLQDILDSTQIYSGMYANVGVTFFGYNAGTNKGIGVGLENIQKIADGEPLGDSRASADDDFAGLAAPAQPQQYTAPAQPQPTYAPQQTAPWSAQQGFTVPQIDPITGLPM